VPIQVAAGAVVMLGRAWVGVAGKDLRVTQRHAGAQGVGDRCRGPCLLRPAQGRRQDLDGNHARPPSKTVEHRLPGHDRRHDHGHPLKLHDGPGRANGDTTLTPARPAHIPIPAPRTSHFQDPQPRRYAAHHQVGRANTTDPSPPPVDNRGETVRHTITIRSGLSRIPVREAPVETLLGAICPAASHGQR
jgi:hypothetical protein